MHRAGIRIQGVMATELPAAKTYELGAGFS